MTSKRPLTTRGAQKLSDRERAAGIDPEDDASKWLQERDPPPPAVPKAATSKALHRWRQEQLKKKR
jgi:hypothetical protein